MNHESLVSYIDVYATLADIIGYKLNCNEAPDSRSLFPILKGGSIEPTEQIHFAAGDHSGAWYSLRDGPWKFIDSDTDPQLYNLSRDLKEEKNLISKFHDRAKKMKNKLDQMVAQIFEREEITQKGLITICR